MQRLYQFFESVNIDQIRRDQAKIVYAYMPVYVRNQCLQHILDTMAALEVYSPQSLALPLLEESVDVLRTNDGVRVGLSASRERGATAHQLNLIRIGRELNAATGAL